jgi:hypothetical protein
MRAKLRMWMGSWRVWVTIGCLVYIGLDRMLAPFTAAWPGMVWVASGLLLMALLFVSVIVSWILIHYVLRPFIRVSLGDQKFPSRTPKAKEKLADSLMSVGTALHSATFIGLLVFPCTAFIQAMTSGTDPVSALVAWWRPERWSGWHTGVFFVLFWLPLWVGRATQRQALDLYDELAATAALPQAPAMAPTAQGLQEVISHGS